MAQSFLQPVDIECETCLDACLSMDSASEIHFRKRRIWIRSALWESSLSFIVRVFSPYCFWHDGLNNLLWLHELPPIVTQFCLSSE